MRYAYCMSRVSPTLEAFRAAFRRPLLTFAEIAWRWAVGATATILFFFGLFEFLDTLPVTNGDLLFLRTRQPFFVWQAVLHILHGSFRRAAFSLITAALLLALFWIIAASFGRLATVQAMLAYFRARFSASGAHPDGEKADASPGVSGEASIVPLLRLNFLRVAVALAGLVGLAGAAAIAGFGSSASHPRPALVFLLFVPLAGLVCLIGYSLNWFLSLAAVFVVRDGCDAVEAIGSAVTLCRDRLTAVSAVSTWTELLHLAVFIGASTVVSLPLAFIGLLPWRLIALLMILVTLVYLAVADWLYTARLAGYVCIVEMPDALLAPAPPSVPRDAPLVQTSIDRDEVILSDVPILPAET